MDSYCKILKVCKIESTNFAKFCIENKVDYLGIHILAPKKLSGEKILLCESISKIGGKAVLVTKSKNIIWIRKTMLKLKCICLQLHFLPSEKLVLGLLKLLPSIKLFLVITNELSLSEIEFIYKYATIVIYDKSFMGGTGDTFERTLHISTKQQKTTLIAGGVDLKLIQSSQFNNYAGFDIQTYFRDKYSKNNYFFKLRSVCRVLKSKNMSSKMSLSLTDITIDKISNILSYPTIPIYDYHLDYSDGSLYKNFITKTDTVLKLSSLVDIPISVHIFSKNNINLIIENLISNYPYTIDTFFVQYYVNLPQILNKNIVISVYHEDFDEFCKSNIQYQKISIILPKDKDKRIAFLERIISNCVLQKKEIWFDREMDLQKVIEIKRYFSHFNIIVGKYFSSNKKIVDTYDALNIDK